MSEKGTHIGRHDDRNRGAHAKLHANLLRHPERAKDLVEHWNDDPAAADPEQARENTGNRPADEDRRRKPSDLGGGNCEHANHPVVVY